MKMHSKVGSTMIFQKHVVYNCKLSYILKLICTIQLLLQTPVGSHNRISVIWNKDTSA